MTNDISRLRVAHVIDSLSPGGAEQMAVNIVNGLHRKGVSTILIVTRGDGLLRAKIDPAVQVIFIYKKGVFDVFALKRLSAAIQKNNINIVHAHSSSIYWASLLSVFQSKVKLVWHNHFGGSANLNSRKTFFLKLIAKAWDRVIVVSEDLKQWVVEKLKVPGNKVSFINNFAVIDQDRSLEIDFPLGSSGKINIVCVANLRPEKGHETLLSAFEIVAEKNADAILHLIGNNPESVYSKNVVSIIGNHKFRERIYYHGLQKNVGRWLRLMTIGVLPSMFEGLPVALLEYGMAGLPVVASSVGQVSSVLQEGRFGKLIPPSSPEVLASALLSMIEDIEEWTERAVEFARFLELNYSESSMTQKLIDIYCVLCSDLVTTNVV